MHKTAKRYDVTDCKDADHILTKCGLMWEPELRPAAALQGDLSDNGGFRAVVNPATNTALAYVGDRFRSNSHVGAIRDMSGLIRSGAIVPHNVSVWNGGSKLAAQFRCPDLDAHIGPRSVVSPLLTLYITHDGTASDKVFFFDRDFWCENQLGMVARVAGEGARHTASIGRKWDELVEGRILELKDGKLHERYDLMRKLADTSVQVKGRRLVEYFASALDLEPSSVEDTYKEALEGEVLSRDGKVLKALVQDWRKDDHGVPGTPWHAYSAVTRYSTHTEGRNEASRSLRALTGLQDRYSRAFNEAVKLLPGG